MEIFYSSTDGSLWHSYRYDDGEWTANRLALAGDIDGGMTPKSVVAVSRKPGTMDVMFITKNGAICHSRTTAAGRAVASSLPPPHTLTPGWPSCCAKAAS